MLIKDIFKFVKEGTRPFRNHFNEQYPHGLDNNWTDISVSAIKAFGQLMVIEDPEELKANIMDTKFGTFQFDGPGLNDDRTKFIKRGIYEFIAAGRAEFFGIAKDQPLPEDTPVEKIEQFAQRTFEIIGTLNPKGLVKDGQWEDAFGPLLMAEVCNQFSNNSDYLAFDGPATPDDHIIKSITKQFYDHIPPESHRQWLNLMGKYSLKSIDTWIRVFDKLDERGGEDQTNFMKWAHQSN